MTKNPKIRFLNFKRKKPSRDENGELIGESQKCIMFWPYQPI